MKFKFLKFQNFKTRFFFFFFFLFCKKFIGQVYQVDAQKVKAYRYQLQTIKLVHLNNNKSSY